MVRINVPEFLLAVAKFQRCANRDPPSKHLHLNNHFKNNATMLPARIAQLVRALDLKTRGCGFDSRAGQPNNYKLSFG